MLKASLWAVVTFHMAVVIFNILALFIVPFLQPWYIALPIDTLIVNLMFSSVPCPLTRLESKIRKKLGMPEVRFFVGHYIVFPLRKILVKETPV